MIQSRDQQATSCGCRLFQLQLVSRTKGTETSTGSLTDDDCSNPHHFFFTFTVCPDYKWGRCPNYEHCQFRHPPRCWTWLEKGSCSYKKKCRYHHPPICYNSLWQGECYNKECKFFHLQKTKRVKIEEEQLKASLNAGNYQSQFPNLPLQNIN